MLSIQSAEQIGGEPLAISMGFFDGVHIGHRQLLANVANVAKQNGYRTAVYTFWPHPRLVLDKDAESLQLLNTPEEKRLLLESLGVDYLIVNEFTTELFAMPAEDYLRQLVQRFNVRHIAVGHNHRFGKGGRGNAKMIAAMADTLGYTYTIVREVLCMGNGVSSTQIRTALSEGNLSLANAMLGRPYPIGGTVVRGQQLGRQLGFPTANIEPEHPLKLIPADGAYAAVAAIDGQLHPAMLHIGPRPTVNGHRTIEAHIIGLEREIYGSKLLLSVAEQLRPTQRFASAQALAQQLQADLQATEHLMHGIDLRTIAPQHLQTTNNQ